MEGDFLMEPEHLVAMILILGIMMVILMVVI
jgi:hypothetical protein